MFLLPLRHEKETVRRWPWVSLTIIAVCLLAFLAVEQRAKAADEVANSLAIEVFEYYSTHTYLELDPALMSKIFPFFGTANPGGASGDDSPGYGGIEGDDYSYGDEEPYEEGLGYLSGFGSGKPGPLTLKKQQEHLDELSAALREALENRPHERWGLVPSDKKPSGFVTYMFMHAGWMHLLGNLFFLYLTGPFIEDLWGRPIFTVFYLLAGVIAAALYAVQYPGLQVPLIGASGAVAGLMGAFLVRFGRTKIRFFYFLWFFRIYTGTFWAPALLMLPLWFAGELWSAYFMDALAPGAGGGGTAHWAHVWGFLFGAGSAVAAGIFKVEDHHNKTTIDPDLEVFENPVVEEAHKASAEGRNEEAFQLLYDEVGRRPSNRDAALALWDLAVAEERTQEAAQAMGRLVRDELASGDDEMGIYHWHELKTHVPDFSPELAVKIRVSEGLVFVGDREEAIELLLSAEKEVTANTGPGAVRRLAVAAAKVDANLGVRIARSLLDKCTLPPEVETELYALAETSSPDGGDGSAGPGSETKLPPLPGTSIFRVLEGAPTRVGSISIELKMDSGKPAKIHFDQVRAVAVGGIREAGAARPYLIVDLFLDQPDAESPGARVIRCPSRGFNPVKLIPESVGPKAAIGALVGRILMGGAKPLLGCESLADGPVKIFQSIASYEAALRG